MDPVETVKVLDEDFGVMEFMKITPDQLNKRGKLYPVGARHFAQQAQVVQNLLGLVNSGAYQDPAVSAHISGKRIAQIFEEHLGLNKFELVQDNIRIAESLETQQAAAQAQENVAGSIQERQMAADIEDEEMLEEMDEEGMPPPEGVA